MVRKKNILIIKLGAFGDTVIAEGAMHDIRNNYLDAHISVLTTPVYKKIFDRCPWSTVFFLTQGTRAGDLISCSSCGAE